jgi:putative addiction module CopG family antidote
MPTQNVNLSDKQAQFIRKRIDRGGYRNASEVVRAGLRLLEQSEQEDRLKLRRLRLIATEAFAEFDQGNFQTIQASELDQFMGMLDAGVRAREKTLRSKKS